jgi:hypothetical protein
MDVALYCLEAYLTGIMRLGGRPFVKLEGSGSDKGVGWKL